MERKILNARLMKEKLKHHYIDVEIAECCGMINKEEFYSSMKKLFSPSAYNVFVSELRKNQKYRDKHPDFSPYSTKSPDNQDTEIYDIYEECIEDFGNVAASVESLDESDESLNECVESLDESDENLNQSMESLDESDENLNQSMESTVLSLSEFYTLRENTQNDLDKVERAHSSVNSARIQIRNNLRSHQEIFQKLLLQIMEEEKSVTELAQLLDQNEVELKSLTSQIAEYRKNLFEIDAEIERMQKITIFVYINSEIDIDSPFTIEFPEWNEVYTQIRDDEILEDFAVKQIKSLAKVITLCKQLKAENRTYEISFESPTLEEYFNSAIGNQS